MPQGRLAQVLRGLGKVGDERLLVGPETLDDAGVVRIGEGAGLPVLVQTVDFFPPVVDDPALYGAIAAANALSDVYAMGARPLSALTLASFPAGFPEEWMAAILTAGFAKVREAGAVVAGGHTVEGEVQFGFSVTGLADPGRVTANSGARAGDLVYLTKPIGMGAMATGAKLGKIDWQAMRPAAEQMAQLNDRAAEAMLAAGCRACTDVTGFGLLGHGRNLAVASGATLRIAAEKVPVFPGALELARRGVLSGGAKRGRKSLAGEVRVAEGLDEALVNLCYDAETSGGLLIAVPPPASATLESELAARGLPVRRIGEFVARADAAVELR